MGGGGRERRPGKEREGGREGGREGERERRGEESIKNVWENKKHSVHKHVTEFWC